MSMPSTNGRNRPQSLRLPELQRRARAIADFAEHLADDVRRHPERTRAASAALAAWGQRALELMGPPPTQGPRVVRGGLPARLENNPYAAHLSDFVDRAAS